MLDKAIRQARTTFTPGVPVAKSRWPNYRAAFTALELFLLNGSYDRVLGCSAHQTAGPDDPLPSGGGAIRYRLCSRTACDSPGRLDPLKRRCGCTTAGSAASSRRTRAGWTCRAGVRRISPTRPARHSLAASMAASERMALLSDRCVERWSEVVEDAGSWHGRRGDDDGNGCGHEHAVGVSSRQVDGSRPRPLSIQQGRRRIG